MTRLQDYWFASLAGPEDRSHFGRLGDARSELEVPPSGTDQECVLLGDVTLQPPAVGGWQLGSTLGVHAMPQFEGVPSGGLAGTRAYAVYGCV
jgi:hypothetical protein